jgi:hypothetical protein
MEYTVLFFRKTGNTGIELFSLAVAQMAGEFDNVVILQK